MDCVPESFDGVIGDGSHCGLEKGGSGLTKAEEDLATLRTLNNSVHFYLGGGERPVVGGEAASSLPSGSLVRLVRVVRRSPGLVI